MIAYKYSKTPIVDLRIETAWVALDDCFILCEFVIITDIYPSLFYSGFLLSGIQVYEYTNLVFKILYH
jgi:hypothetical protein